MRSPDGQARAAGLRKEATRSVIAIAGSLRRDSLNRRLLEAAAAHAPPSLSIRLFRDLADIPLFNEDLEHGDGPDGVVRLREAIAGSAGLLIATPEYNQSVPGVVKNLVDWLSRGEPSVLSGRPVGLLGATPGPWGTRLAQSVLRHSLTACGALTMPTPQFYLAAAGEILRDGRLGDEPTRARLEDYLTAFAGWIETTGAPTKAGAADARDT